MLGVEFDLTVHFVKRWLSTNIFLLEMQTTKLTANLPP
jgi:hypothetical protein